MIGYGWNCRTYSGTIIVVVMVALIVTGCGGGSDAPDPTSSAGMGVQADGHQSGVEKVSGKVSPAKERESTDVGGGEKSGPRIQTPKSGRERAATPKEEAQATVADMALASPSLSRTASGTALLTSAYTCDGADTWPSLRWLGVPNGTKELVLFAMSVAPVNGKVFFDWAVAGIDPGLDEIASGKLPGGAIVGKNSYGQTGYDICPEKTETYFFALFALPTQLSPSRGFDAAALREQVLDISGDVGLLAATYPRR